MPGVIRQCPVGSCTNSGRMKALRRHVHKKHGGAPFVCNSCSEPFLMQSAFNNHNRSMHSQRATCTVRGVDLCTVGCAHEQIRPEPPFDCNVGGKSKARKRKRRRKRSTCKPPQSTVSNTASNFMASGFSSMRTEPSLGTGYSASYQSPPRSQDTNFANYSPSFTTSSTFTRTSNVSASSSTVSGSGNMEALSADQLDSFIAEKVQPDRAFLESCASSVDRLVTFLQNNAPEDLRPRRVVKGGSLGKGTAVKGKSDIDIAVMLANYRDVRTLKQQLPKLLSRLEQYLQDYPDVRIVGQSPHAVQVELTGRDGMSHSVDILPTVDVTEFDSSEAIYRKMKGEDRDITQYYSASFAPWQMDIYKTLPTKLKSLIRLVKFWKKDFIQGNEIPTSYLFELIILDAWTKAGSPENFNTARAFHAVLNSLVNHRDFKVHLEKYSKYPLHEAVKGGSTFIMDPCNPTNDVYNSRNWEWSTVAKAAAEWLNKPMFFGISSTYRNW